MYSFLDPSKAHEFAMDQAQMLNLAQTFQESLEKDLALLNAALDSQDTEPVQRLLHSLKGYVTFLCGPELSQEVGRPCSRHRQSHSPFAKSFV